MRLSALAGAVVALAAPPALGYSLGSKGICLSPTNGCSQAGRCRLHPSIAASSPDPPAWATPPLRALFNTTLQQALNDSLATYGTSLGVIGSGGFQPQMICWPSADAPVWSNSWSINADSGCSSAWAQLGFHPYGNGTGMWLTLVAVDPAISVMYGDYTQYVNTSAIAALRPGDFMVSVVPIPGDAAPHELFDRWASIDDFAAQWTKEETPPPLGSPPTFAPLRTDNDLAAYGYDAACCNPGTLCAKTVDYDEVVLWANWSLTHYDCAGTGVTWNTTGPGPGDGNPLCAGNEVDAPSRSGAGVLATRWGVTSSALACLALFYYLVI